MTAKKLTDALYLSLAALLAVWAFWAAVGQAAAAPYDEPTRTTVNITAQGVNTRGTIGSDPPIELPEAADVTADEPAAPIGDSIPLSWELQQAVVDNCAEFGLEVSVVLGIMDAESDFREDADNGICYGLMQIHKGNAGWVRKNAGVTDICDPAQNIRAGCWILAKGIELHGDIEHALIWYNAGSVYADSTAYSREVLAEAEKWNAESARMLKKIMKGEAGKW